MLEAPGLHAPGLSGEGEAASRDSEELMQAAYPVDSETGCDWLRAPWEGEATC